MPTTGHRAPGSTSLLAAVLLLTACGTDGGATPRAEP
jgi:hypothetical protein